MNNNAPFALSATGARMNKLTGVRAIMKDILETLQTAGSKKFVNLSPGNPLILPEVENLWRDLTHELLASKEYGQVVCRYGASQGYEPLIEAIVTDFNKRYGLSLTNKNILITPGSQSLYFYASNAYGGRSNSGKMRNVVLPLCPDYTGYGGVSIDPHAVVSFRPEIEKNDVTHRFKYRVSLDRLAIDENTGCVLFSRPCNPTGNVLTDAEVSEIARRAKAVNAPVFVDSAYGPPFPALNFTSMNLCFDEPIVHCMSASKAGLPGERIGMAVGNASVIEALECFQSNASIHSSRYGQAILARAITSGKLADISTSVIRPFYQRKSELLQATLDAEMPKSFPWYLHQGEGAIFAWLWLEGISITDLELYQKLKALGVLVVPGSPFFPGLKEEWKHSSECIRISLTADDESLVKGLKILADVIGRGI
jgi:valine--pyruvate aminotransferase